MIRIDDAAIEIGPEGLQAIVNRDDAEAQGDLKVCLRKLDLTVSSEALTTALGALSPGSAAGLRVEVEEGRLRIAGSCCGGRVGLDLRTGSLRLEFTAEGLRLVAG